MLDIKDILGLIEVGAVVVGGWIGAAVAGWLSRFRRNRTGSSRPIKDPRFQHQRINPERRVKANRVLADRRAPGTSTDRRVSDRRQHIRRECDRTLVAVIGTAPIRVTS
jgi:hypothetical protein